MFEGIAKKVFDEDKANEKLLAKVRGIIRKEKADPDLFDKVMLPLGARKNTSTSLSSLTEHVFFTVFNLAINPKTPQTELKNLERFLSQFAEQFNPKYADVGTNKYLSLPIMEDGRPEIFRVFFHLLKVVDPDFDINRSQNKDGFTFLEGVCQMNAGDPNGFKTDHCNKPEPFIRNAIEVGGADVQMRHPQLGKPLHQIMVTHDPETSISKLKTLMEYGADLDEEVQFKPNTFCVFEMGYPHYTSFMDYLNKEYEFWKDIPVTKNNNFAECVVKFHGMVHDLVKDKLDSASQNNLNQKARPRP